MVYMWTDEVIALYTYQAQRDDELSFTVSDTIAVIERPDADWWRGQLHGHIGLFPSNYVTAVVDQQQHIHNELTVASAMQRMYLADYISAQRI